MDARAQLNGALTGRYLVERELGAGGMATVYLAHDLKHDRDVALKVLRPDVAQTVGAERFLREIHLAASLTHPHILPLHDSGEAAGALFYVMPNVEGASLRDRLDQMKQLSIEEAVRIATEVAGALDYAHRHGVVHRDIKPENIMLHDGHALVADFGIGKAISAAEASSLTNVGMSVGTPAYMSPEQAVGEEVDGRSDIYSLGCVLYEMLVGEQPFTGPTIQAVIAKRFVQTPVDVASLREGVSRPVARTVQKSLARLAIDRYDTAASFVTALAEVVDTAATAKPAAPEKSVAVLPFANLSADPENEFFADGITEEILNALATIPDLRVAGRASSFSFKGKSQDLHVIGEQLHVRTVLEGSVRRSGNRVRITAQLSDVTDGYRIWAERYDREIADVFAVQDEIASAIASKLKTTLQHGYTAVAAQRATENIEAYEAYLKGRTLLYRRGAAVNEGVTLMRRALELDPTYAPAWAGLADAYSVFGLYNMLPVDECAATAREAAAKALEFGPDLAESHCAGAEVALLFDWDWERAAGSFRRALTINPRYLQAGVWYSNFYLGLVRGRWEEALEIVLGLAAAEPLSAYGAANVGFVLLQSHRSKEAVEWAKTACRLDSDSFMSRFSLQFALHAEGLHAASIKASDQVLGVSGRMQGSLVVLAVACVANGDIASARAVAQELSARAVREPIGLINRAIVAAALGERDEAIAFARAGFAQRDPNLVFLGRSRIAQPLLDLPEYQELLAAMQPPKVGLTVGS